MLSLLWLIPALPLAGFLALLIGRRLPHGLVATIGCGSVAAAAALSLWLAGTFIAHPPRSGEFSQTLWTWMNVAGFTPTVGLRLDALSLVMIVVVTVVAFLIHLFSITHMAGEEGYGRFFAYMNLFVGCMLILVLADNLLLLYLGWEGVGLCSYLLIGFWYKNSANGRAAMKAFIVTRVGDAAMAVGLFLIYASLGTLDIADIASRAGAQWPVGSGLAVAAAALLLGGAVGKSAQLPLQTWLPDAMAGPSPVSALIHAATMVTAGVYLIARMNVIFSLAPVVQGVIVVIGAATMLLAACSAMVQHDIKRVLAYSTISQIGYMFMALGIGAWGAAILHFATHAFFKALLFLAAGVVIQRLGDEHDMFRMGGLRKQLPLTFWTFLGGAISLSAVLPVTAGAYSKDAILSLTYLAPTELGRAAFVAAMVGVLLTSLYTFRMVFLTFFGPSQGCATGRRRTAEAIPLILLAIVAAFGGLIEYPQAHFGWPSLARFVDATAAEPSGPAADSMVHLIGAAATGLSLLGLIAAAVLYIGPRRWPARLAAGGTGAAVHRFWLGGWGFDRLYDRLLVRPFLAAARINKGDFVDYFYRAIGETNLLLNALVARSQSGKTRQYVAGIAIGAILLVAIMVLL
ncbi:MAG: NADH-quinone oxidoreductase subunit L [Phycisphaerae bacterium]|jgi:NADH-quinone oxidoreductase subunit L